MVLQAWVDPLAEVGRLNVLMEDEWYTGIIDAKRHPEKFLDGDSTTNEKSYNEAMRRKAARYILLEDKLAYRERNGNTSRTVVPFLSSPRFSLPSPLPAITAAVCSRHDRA